MADKTVNQLTELIPADLDTTDLLMVWDSATGTTRKATIDTIADATVSGVDLTLVNATAAAIITDTP